MEANLYDEFGNYIGPEIEEDEEDEETFVPPPQEDEEMGGEEADQRMEEEEGMQCALFLLYNFLIRKLQSQHPELLFYMKTKSIIQMQTKCTPKRRHWCKMRILSLSQNPSLPP